MNQSEQLLHKSKQPRELYALFFAAMWDRFSFYGASALLVLYLTKSVLFSDNKANEFYSSFIALGFAAPVLGGLVADKLIGFNRAILFGAFAIISGNIFLAIPNTEFLYFGFSILTLGMGLFKGNITSLVGMLYQDDDPRRESGFTIFYMGMNLGAILGPIVYGVCAEKLGWHYGFIISAVGMLSGVAVFRFLRLQNVSRAQEIKKSQLPISNLGIFQRKCILYSLFFLLAITISFLFYYPSIANKLLGVFSLFAFASLLLIALRRNALERNHIIVLILLSLFSVFYFACSMQTGSSLTLFIERHMDKELLGINIPTIVFSSLDPIFTIALAPLFIYLWSYLNRQKREPSVMFKLALGLIFTSLSFGFFALATRDLPILGESHPIFWLVLGNMFLGAGELIIFPAITSAFYRYSPPELLGTLMGMWYLSASLSGYVGSVMARISDHLSFAVSSGVAYYQTFIIIAVITLIIGFLALSAMPVVKRLVQN